MSIPSLYEYRVQIRWGDMDARHHVNNTIYLRYMEEARLAWLYSSGMVSESGPEGATLAHISCDFIKSLVYPGEVMVRLTLVRIGRSSIEHTADIVRIDDSGEVYARGKSVLVWSDRASGTSRPLPDAIRARLSV